MNTSNIFKAAHALTKATVKAGDIYSATFAICLKVIYAESKAFKIIESVQIEVASDGKSKELTLNHDEDGVFIYSKDRSKKVYVSHIDGKILVLRNAVFNFELTFSSINSYASAFVNCYNSSNNRKLKIIKTGAECGTWADKRDGKLFSIYDSATHEYIRACYLYV